MNDLSGKRVLLISPRFFGYEQEILRELEFKGAFIEFIQDRPYDKPWQTAITRTFPRLIQPWIDYLYVEKIKVFPTNYFDLVLVINGQTLSQKILTMIKRLNPNAKTIFYTWDSIKNRPNTIEILKFFDKAFTFDPDDALKYSLTLRPLFYIKEFENIKPNSIEYHLSFIGTMHSDRYVIINKIQKKLAPEVTAFWYLYIQAKWVYWLYKIIKPEMRNVSMSKFQFAPINKDSLKMVFEKSRAVVDIEHPMQNGLTLRTFEALGAKKKLVTTNKNIKKCDFYNEDNICVIDRNNPIVPISFLEKEYVNIPSAIYEKYSLSSWLSEIVES